VKTYSFFLISTFLIFNFCSSEDAIIVEPTRDLMEQSIEDNKSLLTYLETHFYNYSVFESNPNSGRNVIKIDTISLINIDRIPLIDQVLSQNITLKTNDASVNHVLYYLSVKDGVGENPSIADSTFVTYQGSLLDGTVFDENTNPIWFDLTQVVIGFREGATKLKPGNYFVNDDNTVLFSDFGQGVLFIPSGLAYFSQSSTVIPAYSPLIFKISLYATKKTDHDGDGILSSDEFDNDKDGVLDDLDEDGVPDYLDNN